MKAADISRRRLIGIVGAGALLFGACGGSDAAGRTGGGESTIPDDQPERDPDTLSGIIREPFPVVNATLMPSLTRPGENIEFKAASGEIQVVYFGFTNCPDICPTTLVDLTVALRKLDVDEPGWSGRVETVVVTVDPGRDLELLPAYATSFISDAIAGGTADEVVLASAAEPFGVSYDVRTLDDGTIEVDHSPFLYVVDDQGQLVLTWQFGASSEDIAADLALLLGRSTA
ncbi:MAG: protein SCO1/2 [Candidatus Aldehydirespiratoraceae bacterium]|jgi:protein SCO1/2